MPDPPTPNLKELQTRYELPDAAAEQLRHFATMLSEDELAPTTVRDPVAVLKDHLADSLVALELPIFRRDGLTVADLGAGAGVPGIPLAVGMPRASVFLVEGNGRKCDFMQRAVEAVGITNARVVNARAETWQDGLGANDVVTARALASLGIVAEYAAPLLRVGGSLVAWRGRRDPDVETAGRRAAAVLGLEVQEPVRVRPYEGADHRYLHVLTKVAETPPRFPRRDGVARKRPLGGA